MARLLLFVCLLLGLFSKLGEGLSCHECTTLASPTCLDYYNGDDMAENLSDCDDGSHCVKAKTVVKIRDSGYIMGWERDSIVVTRYCDPIRDLPTGCTKWELNGGFRIRCRCDTDGCNSAGFVRPGFFTTAVAIFALVWLMRGNLICHEF